MAVFFVVVRDFVLHHSFVLAIENDSGSTLLHVVNTTILERCLALARFQIFEAIIEQNGAAFAVRYQFNVVSYVSSNEACEVNVKKCEIILD